MVAILGMVGLHELIKVGSLERFGLECVVDVSAVVEDPELIGPWLLTGGLQPIIPEDGGEVPGFADDLLGGGARQVLPVFGSIQMRSIQVP
jgi:hypothetical protein